MKTPSILFVSHQATRTGAPLLLLHLLRWLRRHTDWHMEVLLVGGGELSGDFASLAPTSTLPPWSTQLRPRAIRERLAHRRVIKRLKSRPWSLVYSNTAANGEILRVLGSRQPVISHIHELANTIRQMGADNIDNVRRYTTRYIACAEAVKRDLVEAWPIDAARVDVVHGFVDMPLVDDREAARLRRKICAELGIPQNAFVVGASGVVAWRKAPDVFIALASRVNMRCPDTPVHFVWMGAFDDTISEQQLDHDLRGLGLTGLVHFIGSRADARPYFHAFDVFAMVSREDPFPLVCLEAAAAGAPIVCFDYAGGAKEFVEDDCGAVLPYQDVDAMAAAILRLRTSDELRLEQGRCAAEKARRRHDIDSAAPKIVEIIEHLLTEGAQTAGVDAHGKHWAPMPPAVHRDAAVHTDV